MATIILSPIEAKILEELSQIKNSKKMNSGSYFVDLKMTEKEVKTLVDTIASYYGVEIKTDIEEIPSVQGLYFEIIKGFEERYLQMSEFERYIVNYIRIITNEIYFSLDRTFNDLDFDDLDVEDLILATERYVGDLNIPEKSVNIDMTIREYCNMVSSPKK